MVHPTLKSAVSTPWPHFQLCASLQQILTTPLIAAFYFLKAATLQPAEKNTMYTWLYIYHNHMVTKGTECACRTEIRYYTYGTDPCMLPDAVLCNSLHHSSKYRNLCHLENVTIANALQLEAAQASPALSRSNYEAMPTSKSPNPSIAVLLRFCC